MDLSPVLPLHPVIGPGQRFGQPPQVEAPRVLYAGHASPLSRVRALLRPAGRPRGDSVRVLFNAPVRVPVASSEMMPPLKGSSGVLHRPHLRGRVPGCDLHHPVERLGLPAVRICNLALHLRQSAPAGYPATSGRRPNCEPDSPVKPDRVRERPSTGTSGGSASSRLRTMNDALSHRPTPSWKLTVFSQGAAPNTGHSRAAAGPRSGPAGRDERRPGCSSVSVSHQ